MLPVFFLRTASSPPVLRSPSGRSGQEEERSLLNPARICPVCPVGWWMRRHGSRLLNCSHASHSAAPSCLSIFVNPRNSSPAICPVPSMSHWPICRGGRRTCRPATNDAEAGKSSAEQRETSGLRGGGRPRTGKGLPRHARSRKQKNVDEVTLSHRQTGSRRGEELDGIRRGRVEDCRP